MNRAQAAKILNLRPDMVDNCIRNKTIKIDLTGKLIDDSVYEYLKELEERRKQKKPVWIKRNEF